MRELEHESLFRPPPETRAVVVPCCGEFRPHGKTVRTPMRLPYAAAARARFRSIDINIAVLLWRMGVTAHPLTCDVNGRIKLPGKKAQRLRLPLQYHLIVLPTRALDRAPIKVDFLCKQLRALSLLIDGRLPWLAEGQIVLPQICEDPELEVGHDGPPHDWHYFRTYVEPWLSDRFTVISGRRSPT